MQQLKQGCLNISFRIVNDPRSLCVFSSALATLATLVRDIIITQRTYGLDFLLLLWDSRLRNDVVFRSDYLAILIPFHFIFFAREHGIGLGLFKETTLRTSLWKDETFDVTLRKEEYKTWRYFVTFSSDIMRSWRALPPNVKPMPSSSLSLSLSATVSLLKEIETNFYTRVEPSQQNRTISVGPITRTINSSCGRKPEYSEKTHDFW